MKKQNLKKIITMGLIATSLLAVTPMKANAEWKQDSQGWWYTEGSSYATGWRNISGQWYYFENDGYMAKGWLYTNKGNEGVQYYYLNDDGSMCTGTKEIDGVKYRFDSNGKWTGHTDEEIETILKKEFNKEVKKGSQTIVYDESDNTDYSEFSDDFYTKEFIENYDMIQRNWVNRYSTFEDSLITLSANSAAPEDIIYVKNHKKVLSGLVGKDSNYYYIENGQFVRNSWMKLDDKYVYFNAAGSSSNNMIDGFTTLGENLGINRRFPYDKERNSIRTYYVHSLHFSSDNKEYNEAEFNEAVKNGKIVFEPIGNSIIGENRIGLNYFSGKDELIKETKESWGLN